jgi:hypothetical protein
VYASPPLAETRLARSIRDFSYPVATACDDARVTDETRATSTVEWGVGDGGGRLAALATRRWRRSLVWVLAGLGVLAMIGSLVGPWQVFDSELFGVPETLGLGPGRLASWGTWWIFAATVLSTLVALTLVGQRAPATGTRTIGLVTCVVVAVILVAATISLAESSQLGFLPGDVEPAIGWGLHLAYVTLILFGAALWLAAPGGADTAGSGGTGDGDPDRVRRPGARWSGGERKDPVDEGPRDLSVEPATPDTLQG